MSDDKSHSEALAHRKRLSLERALSFGLTEIHVNSAIEGVQLPEHLMRQPQVILNLSYKFRCEIFDIDAHGIQVTLSFGGQISLCILPWTSLYMIRQVSADNPEGEGELFLESLPSAIARHLGLAPELITSHRAESERAEVLKEPSLNDLAPSETSRGVSTRTSAGRLEDSLDESTSEPESSAENLSESPEEREVKQWVEGLQRVSDAHLELDTPNRSNKNRELESLLGIEGLPQVGELLEELERLSNLESRPSSRSRRSRRDRTRDFHEGEHAPERGIISLVRARSDRS